MNYDELSTGQVADIVVTAIYSFIPATWFAFAADFVELWNLFFRRWNDNQCLSGSMSIGNWGLPTSEHQTDMDTSAPRGGISNQAALNTSGHLRGALAGTSTAGATNVGIASRLVQENSVGWNSGDESNNQQHPAMRAAAPLAYAIFQPGMGTFFQAPSQAFFPAHPVGAGSALVGRGHPLFFTNGFGPSSYNPYFAHYSSPANGGSSGTTEHSPISSTNFQYPLHHLTGISMAFPSGQLLSTVSGATTSISSDVQLPSSAGPPTLAFVSQPRLPTGSSGNPIAVVSSSHSADQVTDVVFPAFVFDEDDSSIPQDLTTHRHESTDISPDERRCQTKSSATLVYAKTVPRPRKPKPAKSVIPRLHVPSQQIPSLLELFASDRSQPAETFIQAASSAWKIQTDDAESLDYWEFLQSFRAKNRSLDKQSVAARSILSHLPQSVRDEIGLREPRKVPNELLDNLKLINREFDEDKHIDCEKPVESTDVDSKWLAKFARELICEPGNRTPIHYPEENDISGFLLGVGLEEINAKSASETKRTVSKRNHPKKCGKMALSRKPQSSSAKRDGLKREIDKALVDLKERLAKLKRRISVVKRISRTEAQGDDTQTEDLTVQLHKVLSE